jgi:hypothetical protein
MFKKIFREKISFNFMNLRKASEQSMNFQDFCENLRITEIYLIFDYFKRLLRSYRGVDIDQEHSQAAKSFGIKISGNFENKFLRNFQEFLCNSRNFKNFQDF